MVQEIPRLESSAVAEPCAGMWRSERFHLVSKTAPDKICAPISDPFSNKTTLSSGSVCFAFIAADNPGDKPGAKIFYYIKKSK